MMNTRKSLIISAFSFLTILIVGYFGEFLVTPLDSEESSKNDVISLKVESKPFLSNVPKIGIFLGSPALWDSAQFLSNIIPDPGLEGLIDRTVIVIKSADEHTFSDNADWSGRPDNFWEGGRFDVRTGKSAGIQGVISSSAQKGSNGFPEFSSDNKLPPLEKDDIVIVTKFSPDIDLFIPNESKGRVKPEPNQHRPGSLGTQSLALIPHKDKSADVVYHYGNEGLTVAKFLPINGPWRLTFWVRSEGENGKLQVLFQRDGSQPFLNKEIPTTSTWTKHVVDFNAIDNGASEVLKFRLYAKGENTRILVDDIELGSLHSLAFPFREEVVEALDKLQPGYLRSDLSGGDTLQNLTAESFGRKTWRARPPPELPSYSYSYPQFLELAQAVNAVPWLIVPVMFSDDEYEELGKFLGNYSKDHHLNEVILELGNENWNWAFRYMAIPYVKQYGEMFERAFKNINKGLEEVGGKVKIIKALNGQYVNPYAAKDFILASPNADALGIAPYFLFSLNAGLSDEERLKQMFNMGNQFYKEQASNMKELKKELIVYEVNLHTTEGNATENERNTLVAGMASGNALAKQLIQGLLLGVKIQAVSSFSGFRNFTSDHKYVKLWGITRDLGSAKVFRPTGLATIMLNRAVGGDAYKLEPSDTTDPSVKDLTMIAFDRKDGWSAAVVSSHSSAIDLEISFPNESALPKRLLTLDAPSLFSTNEEQVEVKIKEIPIESDDRTVRFNVPAWGFVVLLP